ncbi:MAG TPA: TetR/AcrR family transcriptional regulator [Candidatus Dormibacteraeota bacterium]|nr:TetR/AcrR family transcriptional regulator [Candidatus Dormibacteraeota bacterium]
MRTATHPRTAPPPDWELKNLGRRPPRGLRNARDLTTARRIVAAAENIFSEQGLAGARMDEIARAARVNKALLYYYFHSKQELYRFVLETLLSQLRSGVGNPAAAAMSSRMRLAAVVDHFFDFVQRHPNYPRLIQREMMSNGPNIEWIVSEYYRPLHGRLVHLIEEGIACGEFRRVDTGNTALTIVSIMVFYFSAAPVLTRILGHDPLRPREVTRRRRAVHDFLTHGLFRPGAGTQ